MSKNQFKRAIDRFLLDSVIKYKDMEREQKQNEANFLNVNAAVNNVDIYDDPKIDIYNSRELERKIKLTKWVQFKNEGYNNVFNKDAARQNSKIIFSFLGFIACITIFIIGIPYALGKPTNRVARDIVGQIILSGVLSLTFLISFIKFLHYKLTNIWFKRDAVIIKSDYGSSENKNARFKMLIRDNYRSHEIYFDIDKTNILCAVSEYDRVMIAKPTEKSKEVYIISNLDEEQRKNDNFQILSSMKRK